MVAREGIRRHGGFNLSSPDHQGLSYMYMISYAMDNIGVVLFFTVFFFGGPFGFLLSRKSVTNELKLIYSLPIFIVAFTTVAYLYTFSDGYSRYCTYMDIKKSVFNNDCYVSANCDIRGSVQINLKDERFYVSDFYGDHPTISMNEFLTGKLYIQLYEQNYRKLRINILSDSSELSANYQNLRNPTEKGTYNTGVSGTATIKVTGLIDNMTYVYTMKINERPPSKVRGPYDTPVEKIANDILSFAISAIEDYCSKFPASNYKLTTQPCPDKK